MGFNFRIYFRSIQKVFFEDNPVMVAFIQLKRIIEICSEFNGRSRKISTSINQTKSKLEETKKAINLELKQNNFNSINLTR
jgi:hypothetical protein